VVYPPLERNYSVFTNHWYPLEQTAVVVALTEVVVRSLNEQRCLGDKMEAFAGRGLGDFMFCRHLGDLLKVVDGRNIAKSVRPVRTIFTIGQRKPIEPSWLEPARSWIATRGNDRSVAIPNKSGVGRNVPAGIAGPLS
jgi:hypothetical protein